MGDDGSVDALRRYVSLHVRTNRSGCPLSVLGASDEFARVVDYRRIEGSTWEVWWTAFCQDSAECGNEMVGVDVDEEFTALTGTTTVYTVGGGCDEGEGQWA